MFDFNQLSLDSIMANPLWIVSQTIIVIIICLILGKVHEFLHIYKAKKLGYTVKSFKWWKNETDINIEPDDPNVRKIALMPYVVLIPFGWLLVLIGLVFGSFAVMTSGFITVVIHALSVRKEGVEE